MSAFSNMNMAIKNTFLDVLEECQEGGARRRPCSMPPAVGRRSTKEEQGVDELAAADQLLRLDAIVRDGAKLQGLAGKEDRSEASTAPSPAAETGRVTRWSSCSDEDEATPTSAAGSTTSTPDLPSAGSAGHAAGTCRPCAFARSANGCKFGAACSFCHLVSEHPETVRMRPCKGKRERFKRTMAVIEAKVAENPEMLSNGELSLPAFVDRNPQARARVMAQLAQVAAEAHRSNAAS